MSVTIVSEPQVTSVKPVSDLLPGTWFLERDGQVYVVVIDDRTHEKRILCLGNQYQPFIVNIPVDRMIVDKVLQIGTMLQISSVIREEENHAK